MSMNNKMSQYCSHKIVEGLYSRSPGYNLSKLPDSVTISTMTITCALKTTINIQNLGKYLKLSTNDVVYKKYVDDKNGLTIRSIRHIKKKTKRKNTKANKKNFYNQITLKIQTNNKEVNVKLFQNGSIQLTGCKSVINFVETMIILCNILKTVVAIREDNKINIKSYVNSPENVHVDKIEDFCIRMINCGFDVDFLIDRDELYKFLEKKNIFSTYEPCIHACVNIKHTYVDGSVISIFVFETGAILITGARKRNHIISAYKFIIDLLYKNYNTIVKLDIQQLLDTNSYIKKLPSVYDSKNLNLQNAVSGINMKIDYIGLDSATVA